MRAGAEIAEFEIAHVQAFKELILRENIDCDFTLTRTCDVWNNQDAADNAKAVYDRLRLNPELSYMEDVQFTMGKDAETVSSILPILKNVALLIGLRSLVLKVPKHVRLTLLPPYLHTS